VREWCWSLQRKWQTNKLYSQGFARSLILDTVVYFLTFHPDALWSCWCGMAKWVELKKKIKKVNGQTYTGIKLSGLKSHWRPFIILGEWQPFFLIESKLFHSCTDCWLLFFNSTFAAICRITKSAVYLNTPLGFEFQSSKHLFVVPCHAHPHLRGIRGMSPSLPRRSPPSRGKG